MTSYVLLGLASYCLVRITASHCIRSWTEKLQTTIGLCGLARSYLQGHLRLDVLHVVGVGARRDSRRRELRTGGLSSAQSWFGWRAHIALEDPVGTAGGQVLTPAIASASRHIADEAEAPTLAAELRARIDAAKVALQGGGRGLMAQGSDAGAQVSALRFGVAGESAEALVGEAWVRCKVIGDGEGADEVMVMLVAGPQAGDTCVVDSRCDLRRPAGEDDARSARVAQARQMYEEVRDGVAESYSSLPDRDRLRLDRAVAELRETLEAFVYHETHGREHLPLELSRFMRLRAGLLRRGRAARRSDDRWPTCGRCGKRGRGAEDPTNATWYCTPCWAEWEVGQRQSSEAGGPRPRPRSAGVVPGSWIRGSANSALVAAGSTIVEQRREILDLQSELAASRRCTSELESSYLEREELCEGSDRAVDATLRLRRIEAATAAERAWEAERESQARPEPRPERPRARVRYSPPRASPKPLSDVVAPADLPPSSLRTALLSGGR